VCLEKEIPVGYDKLYLSVFPALSLGLAVNLEGFLMGLKLSFSPVVLPIPASSIGNYPLDFLQARVFIGGAF
jgi:hypothetical protein